MTRIFTTETLRSLAASDTNRDRIRRKARQRVARIPERDLAEAERHYAKQRESARTAAAAELYGYHVVLVRRRIRGG